ncbi:zinc finger CCCH domain-containing protein 18-like [Triticum dicoccoides]|uniref:zinc finger CCCH domain-containing protein 18-like n=1 Tax=Triticum dicoccoides TaxID=85692 RepID=UPI0018902FB0|nr:zinc finger CCCH domain-containing protein 18-like [Triticum dicoccoides]
MAADAPSDDPLAGGGDSACSTPFVSAPSSPTRDPFSGHHHAACFFSAPASPTRGASNEFACGGLDFDFDFDFSSRFPSPSAAAMSSADELFHNGQIRPVRLSSMLLQPHQPHLASPSQAPVVVEEGERGRFRGRSVHRKARSLSPFRAHWRSPSAAPPPESDSVEPAATPPASRSSSSSSTASSASFSSSRSSRRWGFIKDLLHRSKSDGGKDSQHPAAPAPPTFSATPKRSPSPSPSPAAARSRGAGRGRRRSAHERLYEARRAEAEEMRRRTYLPYRQGGLLLFGCIGLGNRSYGTAVHGLARGLSTATATAVSSRS